MTIKYEPNEDLCVRLKDGKIDICVFLSNDCNSEPELLHAMDVWVNGQEDESVIIAPHFTVGSTLDGLISSWAMPGQNNDIDIDEKPTFDALRAELVAEIARIDALKFST